MTRIDPGHREILRTLLNAGVDFVVVGGVGLQSFGFSAATKDVDVAVAIDPANIERLNSALKRMDARPRQTGDLGTRYLTRHGLLDVLDRTDIGPYERWMENARERDLGDGVKPRVGSAKDLLLVKERADRPADRTVLPSARADLLASGELTAADVEGKEVAAEELRVPDAAAEAILGNRPADTKAAALWDHGQDLIERFRERWSIEGLRAPLGAEAPAGTPQSDDRSELEVKLNRVRRLIALSEDD